MPGRYRGFFLCVPRADNIDLMRFCIQQHNSSAPTSWGPALQQLWCGVGQQPCLQGVVPRPWCNSPIRLDWPSGAAAASQPSTDSTHLSYLHSSTGCFWLHRSMRVVNNQFCGNRSVSKSGDRLVFVCAGVPCGIEGLSHRAAWEIKS